jgi:hypothetical protein
MVDLLLAQAADFNAAIVANHRSTGSLEVYLK